MVEWKSEGIEKNLISLLLFGWDWKSGGMKKYICKYLHIPLLKNDALLKKKIVTKKANHPNLLGNKNHI